jgi:hypothetical protein
MVHSPIQQLQLQPASSQGEEVGDEIRIDGNWDRERFQDRADEFVTFRETAYDACSGCASLLNPTARQ